MMEISDERLGDLWRMPDHYMRPISFARAVLDLQEADALAAIKARTEMDEAVAAGDGTLHGAIDHWQERALKAEADIKAARVQALEPMSDEDAVSLGRTASTNNTYSGGRFLTALFNRDALIGFVRAIEAHHAIRLLGEDAGKP